MVSNFEVDIVLVEQHITLDAEENPVGTVPSALELTIYGDPPAQQRHRIAWKKRAMKGRRFPWVYDPSAGIKLEYKQKVREALLDFGVYSLPFFTPNGPPTRETTDGLNAKMKFFLSRPPSHFLSTGGLREDAPHYPRGKDIDNLEKFAMDALQGIIYLNDASIKHNKGRVNMAERGKPSLQSAQR